MSTGELIGTIASVFGLFTCKAAITGTDLADIGDDFLYPVRESTGSDGMREG